ncbi:MAG: GFA family protein [Gammaproteobacteria bacterium]|nr:GFA family protein [Gammaproteobacteria bacterium]MDH4254378.1 GFA family protein [Gammaproteobacteria bacterium]MDH5311317.1 GFA family protein [Gammaproteobacteria bacterium]
MAKQGEYQGQCFCGAVHIKATGEPFAMGYCHCKDCRHWSAGPVNAFTLWQRDAVKVTKGADKLATYKKTDASHRQYCTKCGGHVMTDHPPGNFTDVYSAILPGLKFQPGLHVNYESAVLRVKDGLPKLKDFPAEMGGSGKTLPE